MFVALKAKDRTRVTSIAFEWDDAEDELREMAAAGELICPGCEQALWLRTGAIRRRHFAHRRLADCPLEHQSAEVLEVKAQLYRWLEIKYPGKVNLDIAIGVPGYERNPDVVVEAEAGCKFAYWVFDRQQRDRHELLRYGALEGVSLQFIHTASTLETESDSGLLLTASQRDLIAGSDFDTATARCGHLHFIAEDSTVSIYRGLWCAHKPNVYRYGVRRTGTLGSARISPKTGEIVFEEDVQARNQWRELQRPKPPPAPRHKQVIPSAPVHMKECRTENMEPEKVPFNINGPFRCEKCGTVTTNWSQATPGEGTCICRACIKGAWNGAPSGQGGQSDSEETTHD